jgi:hypothetical protein
VEFLLVVLFWLSFTGASFLPVSTSLPDLVDSNSDIPLPLQPLLLVTPGSPLSVELKTLGARSTKIARTMGRFALMMHKHGSIVDQKIAMHMPKVGSANETCV